MHGMLQVLKNEIRLTVFEGLTTSSLFFYLFISFRNFSLKYNHFSFGSEVITEQSSVNPLTSISDQDRISPYNINQTSNENKEKYQLGDYKVI